MTAAGGHPAHGDRAASPELRDLIADPGFTPGLKHLPALIAMQGDADEAVARTAARAVLRIEQRQRDAVAETVEVAAAAATHPARSRLARLLGDLARDGARGRGRAWLLGALTDADPKTRRAAARALSKLPADAATERALVAAWNAASRPEDQRPIAEALAAIGSNAIGETLRQAAVTSASPALVRASLVHDRERARAGAPQVVRVDVPLPVPTTIRFHARRGLEPIVAEEIPAAWRPRIAYSSAVDSETDAPLGEALAVRTALDVGLLVGSSGPRAADLPSAVARLVTSEAARALLTTLTSHEGPIRYRVAFARGGHRRADVWRIAELVRERSSWLVNDPSRSTWEILVHEHHADVQIELVPKAIAHDRFAWRKDTVAASSHPTIAAAIARVAPRRDDDVVWDPFVGAGAELVERARLGPFARLVGTDLDESALRAARANVGRAGVEAELVRADALHFEVRGLTLVLSNPPMGRRVQRGTHARLLERFVQHAATQLSAGGALVWIAPEPEPVRSAATAAGFGLEKAYTVDMGGFPAELMVLRRGRGR